MKTTLVKLQVVRAAGIADRLRGLLLTKRPPVLGLWLPGCRAIHTFGMRYPIDVLFVTRGLRVMSLRERVRPWRAAFCARASDAIELAAGTAARCGIVPGTLLALEVGVPATGGPRTAAAEGAPPNDGEAR